MRLVSLLVLALSLAGCACGTQRIAVTEAAACPSACATHVRVAPRVVAHEIGPSSYARGVLAIPGDAVGCLGHGVTYLGETLRCLLDSLWPKPVPTEVFAAAAPAAAPCAAPVAQAAPQDCGMVEQAYTVNETILVPQTVQKQRVRLFRRVLVPAGEREIECAPAPQTFVDPCPPGSQVAPAAAPAPTDAAPPAGR